MNPPVDAFRLVVRQPNLAPPEATLKVDAGTGALGSIGLPDDPSETARTYVLRHGFFNW